MQPEVFQSAYIVPVLLRGNIIFWLERPQNKSNGNGLRVLEAGTGISWRRRLCHSLPTFWTLMSIVLLNKSGWSDKSILSWLKQKILLALGSERRSAVDSGGRNLPPRCLAWNTKKHNWFRYCPDGEIYRTGNRLFMIMETTGVFSFGTKN